MWNSRRFQYVQKFRILYFNQDVLDHSEEVEVHDLLQAIETVSGKLPHLRAEIWSDKDCVGEIGSSAV